MAQLGRNECCKKERRGPRLTDDSLADATGGL